MKRKEHDEMDTPETTVADEITTNLADALNGEQDSTPSDEAPAPAVDDDQGDATGETDEGHLDTEADDDSDDQDDAADTFPRPVVEKLRRESADRRERARTAEARADDYAHRLHTALVKLDGRLTDPAALPFDADHLDDADALAAAIDNLVAERPELKARRAAGDIGAGTRGDKRRTTGDLMDLLKSLT